MEAMHTHTIGQGDIYPLLYMLGPPIIGIHSVNHCIWDTRIREASCSLTASTSNATAHPSYR